MPEGGKLTGTGDGLAGLVQRFPRSTLSLILLLGVLVLVFIFKPISVEVDLLEKLSRVEYARGVITFIFAIGTIGIAVILTIAGLQTGQDAAERFNRSKEVFTVLVGIFGTILGFYFGNETARQANVPEPPPLELSSPSFQVGTDDAGAPLVEVQASVAGGAAPYDYRITFEPSVMGPVEGSAEDGSIEAQVPVPPDASEQELSVTLTVTDKSGADVSENGELKIPKIGGPP